MHVHTNMCTCGYTCTIIQSYRHVHVATSVCGYNYARVLEHSVCIHFQYACTCQNELFTCTYTMYTVHM